MGFETPTERKIVLSNGVRILLEPLAHVHSAAIGFWVDTGSEQEDEELNGICHFIEHMLFKGTERRAALEIAQSLENTGGTLNAFTDKEHTCFHARVLAEEVPLALDVLTDMLLHSKLDEKEIRREKTVVIEEIKMYDDTPDELVHDMLVESIWSTHPIGRPITGRPKSVRALSRDSLQNFMQRHYTPDRLVVSVVGKFDADAVVTQLEAALGGAAHPEGRAKLPPAAFVPCTKVKYRDIEQVHLALATQGVSIDDERRYALALLNSILGGGMSSRLFQEVREKRGLVYSIGSYESLYRSGGMFAVSAGMSPKHLPTVLKLIHDEMAKATAGEITQAELDGAQQQLKGGLLLSLEVPRHRMSRMAQNELYYGRMITPEETLAKLQKVTLKDIQGVAQDLFQPSGFATSVVGPLRKLPA